MSRQAVEAVIGRAILDEAYRELLFAEPGVALAAYDLTAAEAAAVRAVDAESLDGCAGVEGLRSLIDLVRGQ